MTNTTKLLKISTKNQITIPVQWLKNMGLNQGNSILLEYIDGKIQLINAQKIKIDKLKKFQPIVLNDPKKVDFSNIHNEIYD